MRHTHSKLAQRNDLTITFFWAFSRTFVLVFFSQENILVLRWLYYFLLYRFSSGSVFCIFFIRCLVKGSMGNLINGVFYPAKVWKEFFNLILFVSLLFLTFLETFFLTSEGYFNYYFYLNYIVYILISKEYIFVLY